eukprot:21727_1
MFLIGVFFYWNFIECIYVIIYCILVTDTVYLFHKHFIEYPKYISYANVSKYSNCSDIIVDCKTIMDEVKRNYNEIKNAPQVINILTNSHFINAEKQIAIIVWQYASNHCISLYGEKV